MELKQIVEALLFGAQKPLLPKEIAAILRRVAGGDETGLPRAKEPEIAAALEELKIQYIEARHAFQLAENAGGWQIVTDPAYARWVRELYPESKPARLTGPALETLAIIAYRQPITRADVEAVRGVAVDGVVQSLLERGLVKIGGRAEVPGRPLLYETTQLFLEHFGLRFLDELPNCEELRRANLPTAAPPGPAPVVETEAASVAGQNQ
ncbi:MAG: SMC-Scp complex subunit ScpB [Verrucomicrobiota bacterium]|nr:SMC-Scp complex subunit ScpB [Verrucomicrobiota bacterium]